MRVPQPLKEIDRQDAVVRTLEYDDESVIAVDFGPVTDDISLDVVGDTVLVIVDGSQFEFDLPAEARDVSVNNGVLTIAG